MSHSNQVVYDTNADYYETYRCLKNNKEIASIDQTPKGIIRFRFTNSNIIFGLSPKGKLQVKWNNLEEKKALLNTLENILIPTEGKLRIEPDFQQLWIKHPAPKDFGLYWCNKKFGYSQVYVGHLPKRMRELFRLQVDAYQMLLKMTYQVEEENMEDEHSVFGSPLCIFG